MNPENTGKRYEKRKEELSEKHVEMTKQFIESGWEYLAEENLRKALYCAFGALDKIGAFPKLRFAMGIEYAKQPNSDKPNLDAKLRFPNSLAARALRSVGVTPRTSQPNVRKFENATRDPVGVLYEEFSVGWPRRKVKRTIIDMLEASEIMANQRHGLFDGGPGTYEFGNNFEESPLHERFQKRERQGRSLQVIIVARDNDTGTGKTTLAVNICKKWGDDWGAENATNKPGEYRDFLNNKPEGSVLLADEIGQMYDSRRSMSTENVEVSQDWQMIRTKRYKTISTLPGPSFLDKRLKKLADIMIVCTRRGHARAYRLKVDDSSGDIFREHLCNLEWGALDDDPDYREIEKMKRERLRERFEGGSNEGGEGSDVIEADTRREIRNDMIEQMSQNGLSQTEIAEALDLTQPSVSEILQNR